MLAEGPQAREVIAPLLRGVVGTGCGHQDFIAF